MQRLVCYQAYVLVLNAFRSAALKLELETENLYIRIVEGWTSRLERDSIHECHASLGNDTFFLFPFFCCRLCLHAVCSPSNMVCACKGYDVVVE